MEKIKKIEGREELSQALSLCRRVFDQFVSPGYGPEGRLSFYRVTELELNAAAVKKGLFEFYGAYVEGGLAGVGALREKNQIILLFVDSNYHRRGLGRELVRRMAEDSQSEILTLNASDYAVEAYERMGFVRTGERSLREGIIYTPMAMKIRQK